MILVNLNIMKITIIIMNLSIGICLIVLNDIILPPKHNYAEIQNVNVIVVYILYMTPHDYCNMIFFRTKMHYNLYNLLSHFPIRKILNFNVIIRFKFLLILYITIQNTNKTYFVFKIYSIKYFYYIIKIINIFVKYIRE